MGKFRQYKDFMLELSEYDPETGRYQVAMPPSREWGEPSPVWCELDTGSIENFLYDLELKEIYLDDLITLGEALADRLLPEGTIRTNFLQAVTGTGPDEGVRLRLVIRDNRLHQIPWEYSYLPVKEGARDRTHFLSLEPRVSIVRHVPLNRPADRLSPSDTRKLKILPVMSAPRAPGFDQLNVRKEKRVLEKVFQQFRSEGVQIQWEPFVERATEQDLDDGLLGKPDLFFFSGHGLFSEGQSAGSIVLHDPRDNRGAVFLEASMLAQKLVAAGVRLAYLGACQSSLVQGDTPWTSVAPALVSAGIPAVIAMQYEVLDDMAIVFSRAFYAALLAGWTVDEAVSAGRRAVFSQSEEDGVEWGVLTLYMRSIDGILFQPASSGAETIAPRILAPEYIEGPLIGRQSDWQTALQGIRQGQKVFIYGGFGIGKTRLASELFNQFARSGDYPDGYFWITASGLNSARVLEEVALNLQALQVQKASDIPAKIGVLQRTLSERGQILIGVDEIGDPAIARDLLAATANCPVILNGSRGGVLGGLGVPVELKPLAPADAIQLFFQDSGIQDVPLNAQQSQQIERICDTLEHNPLGIRLAARKYADGESLSHLAEVLQLKPDIWIEEDQSLGAAFMASYQDIKTRPQALQLWLLLASFPSFDAPEQDLREVLSSFSRQDYIDARYDLQKLGLVDVKRERLVLHPLIGRGLRVVEREELKETQVSTFDWLVRYASSHREDFAALDRQRENLLGLLDWYAGEAQWEQVVGLLRSLFHYLRVRGQWQLAFDHLQGTVEHASQLVDPFNHAWALLHRGILRTLRSEFDQAIADLDEAERLFAEQGNLVYQGKTLYRKAGVSHGRGDLALAVRQLRQALKWMGDQVPHDRAGAHERLGSILAAQGKLKQSRQQYNKALVLDDQEVNARTHMALGELDRLAGRMDKAAANFQKARQIAELLGHSLQRADVELQIAYLHYYQGRYVETLAALRSAQEIYEQLGFLNGLAHVQHGRGNLAFAQGELDEAARFYQAALDSNLKIGLKLNAAYNRYQLAVVAHRQGRVNEAELLYDQILGDAIHIGDTVLQSAVLLQMGSLAFELGQKSKADALVQRVYDLSQQIEDRFVQSTALYYKGLIQAQEGYSEDARQNLSLAHAGFAAIGSVDASKVETVLRAITEAFSHGDVSGQANYPTISITPPPIDRVIGGEADLSEEEEEE